jgi:uncharacterized protein YndB with AHSA1/START domain
MTAVSPLGQVLRDEDGLRLEFVRLLDTTIEDAWSALTEPDRMERWMGRWSGDPASGTVDFAMTSEGQVAPQPVRIERCRPPTDLAVEMPSPDGSWHLTATLSERGGRTELVFVHRLAEPYDASAIGPGWQYYLDRLAAAIDGRPVPAEFEEYYPALKDEYQLPA